MASSSLIRQTLEYGSFGDIVRRCGGQQVNSSPTGVEFQGPCLLVDIPEYVDANQLDDQNYSYGHPR